MDEMGYDSNYDTAIWSRSNGQVLLTCECRKDRSYVTTCGYLLLEHGKRRLRQVSCWNRNALARLGHQQSDLKGKKGKTCSDSDH
jgi:hypothetical protein